MIAIEVANSLESVPHCLHLLPYRCRPRGLDVEEHGLAHNSYVPGAEQVQHSEHCLARQADLPFQVD